MPAAKNFNEFYESTLKELLGPLENERKKLTSYGITGFILIGSAVICFIATSMLQEPVAGVLAFILLITAIVLLVIFYNKKKRYRYKFKQEIIWAIIDFIDPGLSYSPTRCINRRDYENSGLFLQKPDRYTGDDYVEGKRDKTFFCFSELHTEYKTSNGKNTQWHTIFKGLFFIGDFNKHFHGRTYVYSENNRQINFLTKLFSSFTWNLEKVKLESPEFENRFIVYSNDQVEARYILTPSFMERLVKLQNIMGSDTSYSFVNTNVHVAVPVKEALFEPAIFSPNDYNKLGDYYNTVHIVFDIIDELNLNLRIWSKE
jgi:Protein of unknown function (DUF3137)